MAAHLNREFVAAANAGERDGLAHDVVGREEDIRQPPVAQALEDLAHPRVVTVIRREQREEEARVDEDHFRPYMDLSCSSPTDSPGVPPFHMPMNSRAAFQPVGSSSSFAGGTSSALASMVTWTLALSLSASGRSGFKTPSSYTASTSIVMALTSEAYCTATPAQPGPLPGAASEQRPDAGTLRRSTGARRVSP